MSPPPLDYAAVSAAATVALIAGLLAGALYFWSLWRGVRLLIESGGALATALHGTLRIGLLAGLFGAASSRGAGALLAAALGLMIARALALREAREPTP